MAPSKRPFDETEDHAEASTDERKTKQPKTDRAAQAAAESNSDSSYVSAAAAIFSDSEGNDSDTAQSSQDASDSELSSSSEEPSSESEGEESEDDTLDLQDEVTNVRPGGKPRITKEGTDSSLIRRLKNFLPEMQEADDELEREREAGTLDKRNIETCEEGRPHIEMNLGLGVLEEKNDDEEGSEDDDMSDDDDNNARDGIMRKLMGERYESPAQNMKIQEVGEG